VPSPYERTIKLEETLAQFMQVSMSNQKSMESSIKNLEVQVGQLAKQLADRSSGSFIRNIEKNSKEECKAVMARSRMEIQVDEGRAEEKVEGYKQQSAAESTLEPVSNFFELEEILEDEDDQEREAQIKESEIEIKMKGDKEKQKEKKKEEEKEKEKEKNQKKEKEKEKVDEEKKKGKNEATREKRKKPTLTEGTKVPYPLVPSRKDKERHLARFLDIFKKLEITLPFGEALQQMPLYAKLLKDMLTKKNWYMHSDTIIVEGNCSVVIQRILPSKHKDPGSVTISCSISEVVVGKALIDLGASINLMSLSMCRRLGELEIMPTRMTL